MENDCYTKDLVVVKGKANQPRARVLCMAKRCGPPVATFLVKAFYVRQTEYHNVKDILWTYTSGKFLLLEHTPPMVLEHTSRCGHSVPPTG